MTTKRVHDLDELVLHRLFFALLPDEGAKREIGALRDSLAPARYHVVDERLHMTLFVHDSPTTPEPELVDRMGETAARMRTPSLRVALAELVGNGDTVCLRPGDHMPVLGAFRERLGFALATAGVPSRRGYRFSPHVTLQHNARQTYNQPILPISWRARELVLVHSLVGLTEHRILGRWAFED